MTMVDHERSNGKRKTAEERDATQRLYDSCRVFGHAWYQIEAKRASHAGYFLQIRCERCSTEREDHVSRHGGIDRRKYTYQDGYRTHEVATRTEWRMLYLRGLK